MKREIARSGGTRPWRALLTTADGRIYERNGLRTVIGCRIHLWRMSRGFRRATKYNGGKTP